MIKNISVFGLGKLGCSMAAVFADKGYEVTGYDVDGGKVDAVQNGRAPVYEHGLGDLIARNRARLHAVSDPIQAVLQSDIAFIVVPTPSGTDGLFETHHAVAAAKSIGKALKEKDGYFVVVLTSTVPPGASRAEIIPVLETVSRKRCGPDFGFCYSPEFIALGSVLRDLTAPDYFLIGQADKRAGDALVEVNRRVAEREPQFCRLTLEEAELAKIATNAYVTMKISYANMLAQICDHLPYTSVDNVTKAIGMDGRIGRKYLSGGLSFGGPCFPRDNVALARFAERLGIDTILPPATDRFNLAHSAYVARRVAALTSSGASVGIVGLSYKPGSHVLQESASLEILRVLRQNGHAVRAFDPLQAEFEPGALPPEVTLAPNLAALAAAVDVLVLAHGDPELCRATLAAAGAAGRPIHLIDCWRIVQAEIPANVRIARLGATDGG